MNKTIAIIGDNFMGSAVFKEAVETTVGVSMEYRLLDLPFPNEPVIQSSDDPAYKGLAEFQGDIDTVIALAKDAHILITHVAPISERVFSELKQLEFLAVSRGGPVN